MRLCSKLCKMRGHCLRFGFPMFLSLLDNFISLAQCFIEKLAHDRKRKLLILPSLCIGQGVKPALDMFGSTGVSCEKLLACVLAVIGNGLPSEICRKMEFIFPLCHCLQTQCGKQSRKASMEDQDRHPHGLDVLLASRENRCD